MTRPLAASSRTSHTVAGKWKKKCECQKTDEAEFSFCPSSMAASMREEPGFSFHDRNLKQSKCSKIQGSVLNMSPGPIKQIPIVVEKPQFAWEPEISLGLFRVSHLWWKCAAGVMAAAADNVRLRLAPCHVIQETEVLLTVQNLTFNHKLHHTTQLIASGFFQPMCGSLAFLYTCVFNITHGFIFSM